MSSGWLFLRDNGRDGIRCAIPLSSVHKILKAEDEGFEGALGHARTIVPEAGAPSHAVPDVILVLNNGGFWAAKGVEMEVSEGSLGYMAIHPGLLKDSPPWCRGILWAAGEEPYFVVNTDALEGDR